MEAETIIRVATFDDLEPMLRIEAKAWPDELRASKEKLSSRIETFPEGNFISVCNNEINGFVCTQIIKHDIGDIPKTWYEATDNGYIKRTHTYNGNYMYGVSLSVSPSVSHENSLKLLEATAKMAVRFNLVGGILGSRIPSYHKYADKMTVESYVFQRNKRGKFLDPELNIYVKAQLKPIKILQNYFNDPDSLNYAVLLEWRNPFYLLGKFFPPARGLLINMTRM